MKTLSAIVLLLSVNAFAEIGAPLNPPSPTSAQQPQQQINQNQPQKAPGAWDDRVFNVGKAPESGTTTGVDGRGRYYADQPDYNSGQRRGWLDSCAKFREDPQAYRDCYNQKKNSELDSVRRSISGVQADRDSEKPVKGPGLLPPSEKPADLDQEVPASSDAEPENN